MAGVELFGYAVLVGCLAYVVAVYALDTEARLVSIDREMRSAERIQASILPRDMPQRSGLAMCARYRPMATMAGDFYDVVRLDDQRVAVIVADVLGHGVSASLIASMVKVAFNAEASHADDPGASLEGMNATLVSVLRESDYVTACYVLIDVATGAVRYGLAGHPPPLLLSPDGTVSPLCEGGTILGQFPAARYSSTSVNAARGSRLLLYTDGVTDAARPDGEFFGVDRLAASLFENRALSAEQYADALLESVLAWRGGGKLEDDVTIVVIDTLR